MLLHHLSHGTVTIPGANGEFLPLFFFAGSSGNERNSIPHPSSAQNVSTNAIYFATSGSVSVIKARDTC